LNTERAGTSCSHAFDEGKGVVVASSGLLAQIMMVSLLFGRIYVIYAVIMIVVDFVKQRAGRASE